MGNTFAFIAEVEHADQVTWNFDDGTTSNLRLPVKDFPIGAYNVVLEAKNTACNLAAKDTLLVVVEGIEYFTPHRVGMDTTVGYFSVRFFGGGLDTNVDVTISKGSLVLKPIQKASPNLAELTLLYSFATAEPGIYDVLLTFPGGGSHLFQSSFEIYKDLPGFNIVATVNGPSRIRTGTWTNYTLSVVNDRGRIANSVVACVVVPKGVQTNIPNITEKRTGKRVIKGDVFNQITMPIDYFNNTYFQGGFDPISDSIVVDYDDIFTHIDSIIAIDIDTLFDIPFQGTVYHFYIPMVIPNGSYNVNFKVKSPSNGNLKLLAYAWPFNLRQNPVSGETLDLIHEMGMQGAALAEYAPNPALKAVGKSAGYIDIGSKVAFTEFFDWYYGVNNADAEFYANQSLALGGELAGNMVPYGKKYEKGIDQINHTKNTMRNATKHIKLTEEIIANAGLSPSMANRLSKDLAHFKDILTNGTSLVTQAQKQAAMDAARNYFAKQGINLTTKQIQEYLFPDDVKTNKPNQTNNTNINSVTSFDPNEIYGPNGFTNSKFIHKESTLGYLVTFENVDTALAPAQVVRVKLHLNPAVYNLSKTLLGDITIAGNTYFFEQDRQTYFRDVDLRPAKNMIVRVNANIDTLLGNIEWLFTSLDAGTMDILSDPLDGFLPPNINFPEGEGSVFFTTQLKKSVQNLDIASCFAEIYFDQNEPILTSTWQNQVDEAMPTSTLLPTVRVENGNEMVLSLLGSDAESGLESFKLFVKIGAGKWNPNGFPLPVANEVRIIGTVGETYNFYVEGRDSVGNQQHKAPVIEASVTIESDESSFNPSFILLPNPSSGSFYVRSNGNFSDVEMMMSDAMGHLVHTQTLTVKTNEDTEVQLFGMASGMYFLRFTLKSGANTVNKLILIRP